MDENKIKLNNGCLKIFKFLKLLYEDQAEYKAVKEIFQEDLEQSENNIQVVLNKYLNSLKVFGIKVVKEKSKYRLDNSIFSIDFDLNDLKALSILQNSCKDFPDEEISENINRLLHKFTLRMSNEDKNTFNALNHNVDYSFYFSELKEQIQKCEQVCKQKYQIAVKYIKNKKILDLVLSPKSVIYDSKTVYLEALDTTKNERYSIPVQNILSMVTRPNKSNQTELNTTVVYKLKNKLAQKYKLKELEQSDGYDENGNLVVICKNASFDAIMERLMRYSYNCEIMSPKFLRERMLNLINETLNNYEK